MLASIECNGEGVEQVSVKDPRPKSSTSQMTRLNVVTRDRIPGGLFSRFGRQELWLHKRQRKLFAVARMGRKAEKQ